MDLLAGLTRREALKAVAATAAITVTGRQAHATVPPVPFTVSIAEAELERMRQRIREYRWFPPMRDGKGNSAGWRYGADIEFLRSLSTYWASEYDWRRTERRVNGFKNFTADVDGLKLHFIHEKASAPNAQAVLLIHGWPYSFISYLGLIDRLAHPERFGGEARDGFDVVVVSVPGYGFSQAPAQPTGLRAFGALYHKLMSDVLGYRRYIVDGGDQGALSAAYMALDYPAHVAGLHQALNFPRHAESPYGSGEVGPNPTKEETAFVKDEATRFMQDSAYFLIHMTRPDTLAPALMDSPVGMAAWMLEKYHAWVDRRGRSLTDIISKDQLLDELTLYFATGTFRSSIWPYAAFQDEAPALPPGRIISVPVGVMAWRDPLNTMPPRSFVERSRPNIIQWTDPPRGGHFAFYEEPELYVADLISFGKRLRGAASPNFPSPKP
jgi:pimeloyl-ACP methyl ester carboxylesterase